MSNHVCLLRQESEHDEAVYSALSEFCRVRIVPNINPDILIPGLCGGSLAFSVVGNEGDLEQKIEQISAAARLFPLHRHVAIVPSLHPQRDEVLERLSGLTQLVLASSPAMVAQFLLQAIASSPDKPKLAKAGAYFESLLETDMDAFVSNGFALLHPQSCQLPSFRPIDVKALSHTFDNLSDIVAADESTLLRRCPLLDAAQASEAANFFGGEDDFVGATD